MSDVSYDGLKATIGANRITRQKWQHLFPKIVAHVASGPCTNGPLGRQCGTCSLFDMISEYMIQQHHQKAQQGANPR